MVVEVSRLVYLDHHIGWTTVHLTRIADGAWIQAGHAFQRLQKRTVRMPKHCNVTAPLLRFIYKTLYAHIDAIIVSMGEETAMSSQLHDEILRKGREEVIVPLHEVTLHAIPGILLNHAFGALRIAKMNQYVDHPNAAQHILQILVIPVGITDDEDRLTRGGQVRSPPEPLLLVPTQGVSPDPLQ